METDETLDATIRRVGDALGREIAASAKRQRRWITTATASAGAIALFGAGILVGGAVSPVPKAVNPPIAVNCYTSQRVGQLNEYGTREDLATAAAEAPDKCNALGKNGELQATVETAASQLNQNSGATCGTLLVAGSQWTFGYYPTSKKSPGGQEWLAQGPHLEPWGDNCVTKAITVPVWIDEAMALCKVSPTRFNAYPRGTRTAAEVCALHDLPVLSF